MFKRLLCLTLLLPLVSGCGTETPTRVEKPSTEPPAICTGSRAARAKVAADIVVSPDDRLALSATELVEVIDAGCAGTGPQ